MRLLDFLRGSPRKSAADTAKERLQIVLAHERVGRDGPDYLPMLQKELLAVIAKYVEIDEDKVRVQLDRNADSSILEVDIELPGPPAKPRARMAG
jgi:cell division topological specificity factor